MDIKNVKLNQIMGIGSKYSAILAEYEIYTAFDLLTLYPSKYEFFESIPLSDCKHDTKITITGRVVSAIVTNYYKKNLKSFTFTIECQRQLLKVIIFNRDYLKKQLHPGRIIMITGKYNEYKKEIIVADIFLDIVKSFCKISYPIKEITSKLLHIFMENILKMQLELPQEYLPQNIIEHYRFIQYPQLYSAMHFPTSKMMITEVQKRLKYEEIISFFIKLNYLNFIHQKSVRPAKNYDIEKVKKMIKTIPFELTVDQKEACNAIFKDFRGPIAMNRLLVGDVGSGKTIVGLIAAYAAFTAGEQVIIMVPTEILAMQHHTYFSQYLVNFKVNIELLTSSVKGQKRQQICEDLALGRCSIIIGTHALLYEELVFKNLGLVIIDEQHKFGVGARNQLLAQKKNVDALHMTATPIPRSLLLTIYSDLDVSTIKTIKATKLPIITELYQTEQLDLVFRKTHDLLSVGQQVYVVVPFIDNEDEEYNIVNVKKILDMEFAGKNIGILHGKLKQNEKDKVMNEFLQNKINILLATTVIEVGISIDNANMIIILGAERFGLSQLHQLRGRVGRSSEQGYALVVSNIKEIKRLEELKNSNDGFYLSEIDLQLRGPGDFFGMRQSGLPDFIFADFQKDYNLFKQLAKIAENIFQLALKNLNSDERDYVKKVLSSLTLDGLN